MYINLFFRPLLLAASLLLAACGGTEPDNNGNKPNTSPTAEIILGEVTETTVEATINFTNAELCYWAVLPASESISSGYEIKKYGNSLSTGGTIRDEGLTRGEGYTIFATAVRGNEYGKPAQHSFTTQKIINTLPSKGWQTTADKRRLFSEIAILTEDDQWAISKQYRLSPEELSALAAIADTIEYEVLCLISARVPRRYI